MSRSHRASAIAGALAFVLLPVALACTDALGSEQLDASLASAGQVDLSGTWILNREESERPAGRIGKPFAGPGRERPGGGPHPGARSARSLTITQTDSTITIARGRRARTLFTDGRTVEHTLHDGVVVQLTASWVEGGLRVERVSQRGTMRESFGLAADGLKLEQLVRIEGDRLEEPVEFRLVFDRES